MSLASAFEEHEAVYREVALRDTWGHLSPQPQHKYSGHILFSHTSYGYFVVINDEFEELDNSPWYYDDLHDFINKWLAKNGKAGNIYRFDGTYVKFKNENYRFSGKVKRVNL